MSETRKGFIEKTLQFPPFWKTIVFYGPLIFDINIKWMFQRMQRSVYNTVMKKMSALLDCFSMFTYYQKTNLNQMGQKSKSIALKLSCQFHKQIKRWEYDNPQS